MCVTRSKVGTGRLQLGVLLGNNNGITCSSHIWIFPVWSRFIEDSYFLKSFGRKRLTGSHSLTVLSPEADAKSSPLVLNRTDMIGAQWPRSVWWSVMEGVVSPPNTWLPISTTHKCSSVSCPPDANRYCFPIVPLPEIYMTTLYSDCFHSWCIPWFSSVHTQWCEFNFTETETCHV